MRLQLCRAASLREFADVFNAHSKASSIRADLFGGVDAPPRLFATCSLRGMKET